MFLSAFKKRQTWFEKRNHKKKKQEWNMPKKNTRYNMNNMAAARKVITNKGIILQNPKKIYQAINNQDRQIYNENCCDLFVHGYLLFSKRLFQL